MSEVKFVVPFTYLQFNFPAVIALNILFTSVQSAAGFLRQVLVSPLSRRSLLLARCWGAMVAVLHGCLVLLLAKFADVSLTLPKILETWG